MIIVCEPNCTGQEHASVNVALLAMIASAYPEAEIRFLAEKEHLWQVANIAKQQTGNNINYEEIRVAPRHAPDIKRFIPDLLAIKKIFDYAGRNDVDKILFTSALSPGLIAIKLWQLFYRRINCLAIVHGPIESIDKLPRRWWLVYPLLFWFRPALLAANNERLNYLVLGDFIKEALTRKFPQLKGYLRSIDLPYFYEAPDNYQPFIDKVVRFASFGVGNSAKGTPQYFKLADDLRRAGTKYNMTEFYLLGPLVVNSLRQVVADNVIIPSADKPLSKEQFLAHARGVDYAVYLYDRAHYKYSSSGALFDAFSHLKPIIALKAPVFEYYFKQMGEIGYLCDTYDEMYNIIIDIAAKKPLESYRRQRENLLNGRRQLSVPVLGRKFAKIWEDDDGKV